MIMILLNNKQKIGLSLVRGLLLCTVLVLAGCAQTGGHKDNNVVISVDALLYEIQLNQSMHTRIVPRVPGSAAIHSSFVPTEYVVVDGEKITDFTYQSLVKTDISDQFGSGTAYRILGNSSVGIDKQVTISIYDGFPGIAIYRVVYTNQSQVALSVQKWVSHSLRIDAGEEKVPAFWSYQGASYEARPDWVLPLSEGFSQQNYMGMNADDYGSGTPVTDVWRRDLGVAIGHVEPVPKLVSLPVEMKDINSGAHISIEHERHTTLTPGQSLDTFNTFIAVHEGDFFSTLRRYSSLLARQGLEMPTAPESAYEPVWCAWGYERNFTLDEVLHTLPKAKELGFEWAVLDDGWQVAEGDWSPITSKYSNGDADMKEFVSKIESAGMKAKLWWAPLAVDPGTDLLRDHTDMLLLDENGSTQDISWWNSYYLCPAYDKTVQYSVDLVKKFIAEWGFKGLKIDGQHLNGVPPCYNPAHHHAYPEESVEKLQDFWKTIYDTAMEIGPDNVIEICPCGTTYSVFNMPYMNQAVSSDPMSSWQIRLKGKVIKALSGDAYPYYGDHVELSDHQDDFASSVGIGAVVGSKFTIAQEGSTNEEALTYHLTAKKEAALKSWVGIYSEKMLPEGEYAGELYDIGFDIPETHVIKKGDNIYYAFYADKFNGKVELRGLAGTVYQISDYVNGVDYGRHKSGDVLIDVSFAQYLLLEATPIN